MKKAETFSFCAKSSSGCQPTLHSGVLLFVLSYMDRVLHVVDRNPPPEVSPTDSPFDRARTSHTDTGSTAPRIWLPGASTRLTCGANSAPIGRSSGLSGPPRKRKQDLIRPLPDRRQFPSVQLQKRRWEPETSTSVPSASPPKSWH